MSPCIKSIQLVVFLAATLVFFRATPAPAKAPKVGSDGQTLVTLHYKDVSPKEVFNDLGYQAGVKFQVGAETMWDAAVPKITVDMDNKSFSEALVQVCGACKLNVQAVSGNTYQLVRGDAKSGPLLISVNEQGVFTAIDATLTRIIHMEAPEKTEVKCQFTTFIMFDPNLPIIELTSREIALTEATDELGQSYVPRPPLDQPPARKWPISMRAQDHADIGYFDLEYPPKPGKRLQVVRGDFSLITQTGSTSVEIPDLLAAQNVIKDIGLLELTFVQAKTVPVSTVKVEVTLGWKKTDDGKLPGMDVLRTVGTTVISRAKLVDADGQELIEPSYGSQGMGEGHIHYELNFASQGHKEFKPVKLVLVLPTEIKNVDIPVEFHDLPLP